MSEQDPNLSPRLEAVLLDKLARQDERIGMLEALLEDTRRQKELQDNLSWERTSEEQTNPEVARPQTTSGEPSTRAMSFESSSGPVRAMSFKTPVQPIRAMSFQAPDPAEPGVVTARPLAAEREPIRLPEFNASSVDAIAELVQVKASERLRPVAALDGLPQKATAQTLLTAEPAESGYEQTARMNAPLLKRRHSVYNAPGNSVIRRTGSMALLSIAVAAMGIGLWQQRQSAFVSASTPDIRSMPLLTPPAPLPAPRPSGAAPAARSVKPLRSVKMFAGKPPILEPSGEPSAVPHPALRIVSVSTAALPGASPRSNSSAPHTASHSVAANGSSHARQIEHKQAVVASARGLKATHTLRPHSRQAGGIQENSQLAESVQTSDIARAESPSTARSNSELSSNADTTQDSPQSVFSPESPEYRDRESRRRRYYSEERERAEAARRAVGLVPRRRRANPAESSEETQAAGEEAPRRQLQGNTRRAMRTLDEMRELLDSIERRKRRSAASGSE